MLYLNRAKNFRLGARPRGPPSKYAHAAR